MLRRSKLKMGISTFLGSGVGWVEPEKVVLKVFNARQSEVPGKAFERCIATRLTSCSVVEISTRSLFVYIAVAEVLLAVMFPLKLSKAEVCFVFCVSQVTRKCNYFFFKKTLQMPRGPHWKCTLVGILSGNVFGLEISHYTCNGAGFFLSDRLSFTCKFLNGARIAVLTLQGTLRCWSWLGREVQVCLLEIVLAGK